MKIKNFSVVSMIACVGLIVGQGLIFEGCGVGAGGPSGTVRKFYQYMDAGDSDKVISLFSREITSNADEDKLKAGMVTSIESLKAKGGIKSLKFVEEEIVDDTATVKVTVTLGNDETSTETIKLAREDGVWKLAPSK